MITVDGSLGEGGGQVLRTALGLSLVTGEPFRIHHIRAGRKKPGLMPQHLTAVNAAGELGGAGVEGAAIGSQQLTFTPQRVRPGDYHFAVRTAGSMTLVAQTLLTALLVADGPSRLTLEGGTHNPFAPPFDFLDKTFLSLVSRMGPTVEAALERPGFYPAGGGRFTVTVTPAAHLAPLELLERGAVRSRRARALVASLPRRIAEREVGIIRKKLGWGEDELSIEEVRNSRGPGNVVMIEIESEHVTEVFTAFGRRGVPAEQVAGLAAEAAREYLAADVPVGTHLADQLLVPLALAGGGRFKTLPLSGHARTNLEIVKRFLPVDARVEETATDQRRVTLTRA